MAPIPFLRALSSPPCLALSLPFLFGVEDQLTSAYWWTKDFGFPELVSPSLKHSSPHIALSGGVL